jgi:hypothetical protein
LYYISNKKARKIYKKIITYSKLFCKKSFQKMTKYEMADTGVQELDERKGD